MATRRVLRRRAWVVLAGVVLAVASGLRDGRAAPPKSSLELVPADAAFYSVSLRNREQFDAVAKSRWWAKLKSLRATQIAAESFQQAWEARGGKGDLGAILADPANRELLAVGADLVSDEVFIYADAGLADWMELYMLASHSSNLAQMLTLFSRDDAGEVLNKVVIEPVLKKALKIKTPRLVAGFKVRDAAATERQLRRLMKQLQEQMAASEYPLAERFKETKINGGPFWTLSLDGDMIPFDEIPALEHCDPELHKSFIAHCKSLKLTLTGGLWQGYLIVAATESTQPLATLGQGPLLVDQPELAPLKKFHDPALLGVSYTSARMTAAQRVTKDTIAQLTAQAKEILARSLPADVSKKALADLEELSRDAGDALPAPGAVLQLSRRHPQGIEGWEYDYGGARQGLDGSGPLGILQHVGGSPLAVLASRTHAAPTAYPTLVKWVKRGRSYLDYVVEANAPPDDLAQYRAVMEKLGPLAVRFDKITGSLFLSSLDLTESALLLDGRLGSKQWLHAIPDADQDLRLPLPGLVTGVRKAESLTKALGEYRTLLNDALAQLRELAPDKTPELKLPESSSRSVAEGTIYWYPLVPMPGLDKRLGFSSGISATKFSLTLAPPLAQRYLASTPPKLGGLLADATQPAAAVAWLDFAALVDLAEPWAHWALEHYVLKGQPADEAKLAHDTTQELAHLLRALRSYSSRTTITPTAAITHSLLHLEDLPAGK